MNPWPKLAVVALLSWATAFGSPGLVAAQTKPEGEMGDVPLFVELRRAGAAGSESKRP
jgi:hypothetical protein